MMSVLLLFTADLQEQRWPVRLRLKHRVASSSTLQAFLNSPKTAIKLMNPIFTFQFFAFLFNTVSGSHFYSKYRLVLWTHEGENHGPFHSVGEFAALLKQILPPGSIRISSS